MFEAQIVIQRPGAPAQDRLDWYAEKLCRGTLKTLRVGTITVQLDVLQDPALLLGQCDNLCRIRVESVDGCHVATEAADSDELMAMYSAMDKMKAVLIERPSNLVEVDRAATLLDESRSGEQL